MLAAVACCIAPFVVAQTACLNAGVGKHSSLIVVSCFVAAFVTCNAVGGGIFFDEFGALSASQRQYYPLGLAMLLAGVLLLTNKKEKVV